MGAAKTGARGTARPTTPLPGSMAGRAVLPRPPAGRYAHAPLAGRWLLQGGDRRGKRLRDVGDELVGAVLDDVAAADDHVADVGRGGGVDGDLGAERGPRPGGADGVERDHAEVGERPGLDPAGLGP